MKSFFAFVLVLVCLFGMSSAWGDYCNVDGVKTTYGLNGVTFEKKDTQATTGIIIAGSLPHQDCFLAALSAASGYLVVRTNGFFGYDFEGIMESNSNVSKWGVGGIEDGAKRAFDFVDRMYPRQFAWVGIDPQFGTDSKDYSRLVGNFLWIGQGTGNFSHLPPQMWKIPVDTSNDDLSQNDDVLSAVQNTLLFARIDPPRSEGWAFIDRNIPDLQTVYHDGQSTPGYFHIPANANQPSNNKALLYVPGGGVDGRAYLEQLKGVADAGFHVFVQALPLGNAFIYPNVESIYQRILAEKGHLFDKLTIAGHSLGSLGAGNLVINHSPKKESSSKVRGYINVSCVCGVNVTTAVDEQASIFGTRDLFPAPAFQQHVKDYMSPDTVVTVIDGANHAQMGSYSIRYTPGSSDNGQLATIPRSEQHQEVTSAMVDHINKI